MYHLILAFGSVAEMRMLRWMSGIH